MPSRPTGHNLLPGGHPKPEVSNTENPRKRPGKFMLDDNADRPISDAYPVIDTDLARDNIENDLPDAERRDV